MEFAELARERFSVRAYTSAEVEADKLETILEAGRLAPTACNLQAFRIVVIRTEDHKAELAKLYRGSFLTQAPLVLGVYADTQGSWIRFDGKSYADVDAAIVMDHMILQAAALGLGTCWIGAFDARVARKLGGLDDEFEPIAFTPVGYPSSPQKAPLSGDPGTQPPSKQRKPIGSIVKYL